MIQAPWKAVWHFLKKLSINFPYDLAISLVGKMKNENIYIHMDSCVNVHSTIIHNSFQLETIQMSEG